MTTELKDINAQIAKIEEDTALLSEKENSNQETINKVNFFVKSSANAWTFRFRMKSS